MKVLLEYRNATPSHCDVAIFLNGKNVGTLRLGQEDLPHFDSIIAHGCVKGIDEFLSRGHSLPPSGEK